MSERSTIEWTDRTWNPTTGCDRVSPGCDNCYALTMARRLKAMGQPKYQRDGNPKTSGPGFGLSMHADVLAEPYTWTTPQRVFVNSMSDLFHQGVSEDFIARVWTVMANTPQHTYQILTKRHDRMRSIVRRIAWRTPTTEERRRGVRGSVAYVQPNEQLNEHLGAPRVLPNVWLGVSVEDQKRAELRVPALLETPAAVRFLSCEPLRGPVDLRNLKTRGRCLIDCLGGDVKDPADGAVICGTPSVIDWVIVGGESGPGARPMHPNWARSLRDQCQGRAAFHFKQWGEWGPAPFIVRVCDPQVGWQGTEEGLVEAKRQAEAAGATHVHTGQWYVEDGQKVWHIHEIGHKPWSLERVGLPDGMEPIRRWGKKHAGRELDGRVWNDFPDTVTASAR